MTQARPDHDFLGALQNLPEAERNSTIAEIEAKGDLAPALEKVILEALLAIKSATPEDSQGEPELSPERTATLTALQSNYERLQLLSNGVTWAAAEKSFRASPDKLDQFGRILKERPNSDLTVVGRKDGEIKFVEVAANCPGVKNIAYDEAAQEEAQRRGERCDGNAVDVTASFGAKPASPDLYEPLRGKVPDLDKNTWAWLLTDAATRANGFALFGNVGYVGMHLASYHSDTRGVRCELGVKEA